MAVTSREAALAELLVRRSVLKREQAQVFAARLETFEGDAVKALKELDVPQDALRRALEAAFPVQFEDELQAPNPADLAWALDLHDFLRERQLHPYLRDDRGCAFLVSDLFLTDYQGQLEGLLGAPVRFLYADADQVRGLYAERPAAPPAEAAAAPAAGGGAKDESPESPIIKAINLVFLDALNEGASDIHIEPFERQVRVRFRVDGVLRQVKTFPSELQPALLSRVKLMAGMDIAERRIPQDGRIKFQVLGADYDMRVSSTPTSWGESAVLRLLKKESVSIDLGKSGFREDVLKKFRAGFGCAHGICLVTGPTGSGKTTTLYGAVNEVNDIDAKIFTIEDPVEYQLEGIVQIPVNPKTGMTFAAGLKAAMRQDPDIIMIGEIRDSETAEIATKAALTGHLVLATLHTNSAPGAISRLLDMKIENFMLASTVELVLAQRLQRRVCKACSKEVPLEDGQKLLFQGVGLPVPDKLFKGAGCEVCGGSGYKGRLGIHEVLVVDHVIRDCIVAGVPEVELTKKAIERGMVELRTDSLMKVALGWSTTEETIRAIGEAGA